LAAATIDWVVGPEAVLGSFLAAGAAGAIGSAPLSWKVSCLSAAPSDSSLARAEANSDEERIRVAAASTGDGIETVESSGIESDEMMRV